MNRLHLHSMRGWSYVAVCLAFGLAAVGCVSPVATDPEADAKIPAWFKIEETRRGFEDEPALTATDRKVVKSILEVSGVDVSNARWFENDWVLADDHVFYDARRVLREAEEDEEKGYFWTGATLVDRYWDIYFTIDPVYQLDLHFLSIFVTAMNEWTDRSSIGFTQNQTEPGPVLVAGMGPFGDEMDCYLGWSTAPSGGQPGMVAINTSFNCTSSSLPAACRASDPWSLGMDQKVHAATHEIGHALGFAHPLDPASSRISGTRAATDANNPTYRSMMWGGPNGCYTGSGNVTRGLSSDDVASANRKYP